MNSHGDREAWIEEKTLCMVIDRLRKVAAVWHRYVGLPQQFWVHWISELVAAVKPTDYHLTTTTQSKLTAIEDRAKKLDQSNKVLKKTSKGVSVECNNICPNARRNGKG